MIFQLLWFRMLFRELLTKDFNLQEAYIEQYVTLMRSTENSISCENSIYSTPNLTNVNLWMKFFMEHLFWKKGKLKARCLFNTTFEILKHVACIDTAWMLTHIFILILTIFQIIHWLFMKWIMNRLGIVNYGNFVQNHEYCRI